MTLLQKALKIPRFKSARVKITKEDLDLVEAWLQGRVSYKQVALTKNKVGSNVYNYLIKVIQQLYILGRIRLKKSD